MTAAIYTARDYRNVSLSTGASVYKIKKWYANGDIKAVETDEVAAYMRRASAPARARLTFDEAVSYLNGDVAKFRAAVQCGALLPLLDGKFYGKDLLQLVPHRFALLPAHTAFTPTRPEPNDPIEWYPHTPKRVEQFMSAFASRRAQCEWWSQDGKVFTIPDGCCATASTRSIKLTWRDERKANAPLYAPDVAADAAGRAVRIRVQGFCSARETVVNLSVMDDYGVWTYSHGRYARFEAWHEALHRAVLALGMQVAPLGDKQATLVFLQQWLDSAAHSV